MRGLFTAGVLDVFQEHDILVDGVVGVSAGALFGCNYISRQAGRALRYNLRFKDDPRYMGLRALWKTGNIVAPEFSYHTLPCELDIFDFETFNNSSVEFHVVATDAEKGVPFYKKIDKMDDTGLEWMRASASMPIVSRPVPIDGHLYLDGGITDPIPLRTAETLGYPRAIVILTQPASYRKTSGPEVTWTRRLLGRRYPALADAMERRADLYNAQTAYVAERQALRSAFVIRPPEPLRISRTASSPAALQRVYDLGTSVALAILSPLLRWLAEPPPPPPPAPS